MKKYKVNSRIYPKTNKVISGVKHCLLIWTLPVTGLFALIWFLVRVIPKPSRATYPCQRVTFPLASGFIVWLLGLLSSAAAFRKAKRSFARARYVVGVIFICTSIWIIWLTIITTDDRTVLADVPIPNMPMGVAKGLHPGRVVWIHDANATDWVYNSKYQTEHWFESEHTDQEVVSKMMSRAIRALAGESTDKAAWDAIFRHFNQTHDRGSVGYVQGQKIAIKVNHTLSCNSSPAVMDKNPPWGDNYMNYIDNSPQLTIALLDQLVNIVGINQNDISIGDPSRIMPNYWYNIVHAVFPDVVYLASYGGKGRTRITYDYDAPFYWSTSAANGKRQDYVPSHFAQADYFINFAVLKSHGESGITVCGKNHYGSLRLPLEGGYYNLHLTRAKEIPSMGRYRALVDLMGHPKLGGKTLLCLIDGLFAGQGWDAKPKKWNIEPFNGDWPSSIFLSMDQVATDSVCFDFLYTEWGDYPRMSGTDDYLHEAALANDPCSGTFYDPDHDGVALESLGAHEHWNNPVDKQYSRNLGTGDGIELTSPVNADFNGDGRVDLEDLATLANQWMQISMELSADIAPYPAGDGLVNVDDFALFAKYWSQ